MGKYMYFELETSYSKERYICKNDTNKYDFAVCFNNTDNNINYDTLYKYARKYEVI